MKKLTSSNLRFRDKFLIIRVLNSIWQTIQSQFVVKCTLNQAVMLGVIDFRGEISRPRISDIDQFEVHNTLIFHIVHIVFVEVFSHKFHLAVIAVLVAISRIKFIAINAHGVMRRTEIHPEIVSAFRLILKMVCRQTNAHIQRGKRGETALVNMLKFNVFHIYTHEITFLFRHVSVNIRK